MTLPPAENVLLWVLLIAVVLAVIWAVDLWQTWTDRREFEAAMRREDAMRALERMAEDEWDR